MKKEMLINVLQPEECRIAIVEDGVLEELYVERTSLENYTGNIYKGKIVNIEPAIQAAFVDFSVGRNGFLHVSDVEPQYYRHHGGEGSDAPEGRERPSRRPDDRPEPRGPRGARPPVTPPPQPPQPPPFDPYDDLPPPRPRDRDRDRDRERPDLSEKGRRDRSRSFGEGLGDEVDPLFPPPRQEAPPPPSRPASPEPTSWSAPLRETHPPERPEFRPERPPYDEIEPRARIGRGPDPIESELPPSRTHRNRPSPPARPFADLDTEAPGEMPPPSSQSFEGEDARPSSRRVPPADPRRSRGRGRPPRGLEPEPFEPPPDPSVAESEPSPSEPPSSESSRRRGGRDAIRSRGGDRPREISPQHPRGLAAERPFEPPPETERPRAQEPPREPERGRGHSRAGEPGYVPRRERGRGPLDAEISELEAARVAPPSWSDEDLLPPSHEHDEDAERSSEGDFEESGEEGRPRRRRRRRRRRGEPREGSAAEAGGNLDDEHDDIEHEPRGEAPPPRRPAARPDFPVEPFDDLDLDDESALDEEPLTPAPAADEEIDAELEEEIRREIEEIAELETEMGLRGRGEPIPSSARPARGRSLDKPPIQEVFRRGDEVLVQVIKESIGTKGPTLSTYISIPGRYLVLMPGLSRVGVSRKIADEGQRRRLREIMTALNPPKGLGFIVRTAGLERTKRELARDLAYLLRLWKVILKRIKKAKSPAPIYQESDMITRTIRDVFSADIDTIWIDEPQAFERAQEFLRVVMPKFVNRLKLYDEKVPLFHKYGIEEEISKIQRRHVPLPEGGSIVIDPTEALVAIDVNSGNFRVEDDAERTAYEMNLRAAKEIARQLRLRDLGGVIVNDFIDMREEKHRRGVERALRDAVKRDRARTKILRMSQFGLVEMTRQRIRPSLKRSIYEDCTHCKGAGVAKTAESMSIEVMRLLALASHRPEIRRIHVTVSAAVAMYLNNRKRPEIARLESEGHLTITIEHEAGAPAEHLQFDCHDAQGAEVRVLPPPQTTHPKRGR